MRQISIVLPNFNSVKYLTKVIDAFLSQDYAYKRLYIVDGKSTDDSHRVINSYAKQYNEITWLKESDKGISSAINIALKHIDSRDIWGYLGADDLLLPGVLTKVSHYFSMVEGVNGVYFDSYTLVKQNNKVTYRQCPANTLSIPALLKYGTIVGLQNIFIDANLIKKFGFDEQSKYSMDYELYLRLALSKNTLFFYIPEPSTINIQDGNISQLYALNANSEALETVYKKFGISTKLMCRYFRHNLSKLRHYFFSD